MANPVVHFEVMGKDGKKLQRFYSELFGWKIDTNNPMNYGTIGAGGDHKIGGGIGQADNPHGVTFYVSVPDPKATLAKAEQLGGKTVLAPHEIPGAGVTLAQFKDPEGHLIGLTKA